MNPLFGAPKSVAAATLLTAAGISAVATSERFDITSGTPPALKPAAEISLVASLGILLTAAVVGVQRYCVSPFQRIMARDTACMLRSSNFRQEFEARSRSIDHRTHCTQLGITPSWDNPGYGRIYRQSGPLVIEIESASPAQILLETLRTLLGSKDEVSRKHAPGRLTPGLREGKRSVTAIMKQYPSEIAAVKNGTLDLSDGVALLTKIRATYCEPGSEPFHFITRQVRRLESKNTLADGDVQAQIWERNPWRDLTSQKEFFSSASLRSGSLFEAGSKGRLGNFGYLRNPAICCLDFSTNKGRVVRARLVAGTLSTEGRTIPTLFVDGIEGTNSVPPAIIKNAVEAYGRECGFKMIAFNAMVHNQTPRLFVTYLCEQGVPCRELLFSATDIRTREYLDAFGVPLQPFEYAFPRGVVRAHVVALSDEPVPELSVHSLRGKIHRLLHQHGLHLLYGTTTACSILLISQVSWLGAAAMGGVCVVGWLSNRWYQGRAARARHSRSRASRRDPGDT